MCKCLRKDWGLRSSYRYFFELPFSSSVSYPVDSYSLSVLGHDDLFRFRHMVLTKPRFIPRDFIFSGQVLNFAGYPLVEIWYDYRCNLAPRVTIDNWGFSLWILSISKGCSSRPLLLFSLV